MGERVIERLDRSKAEQVGIIGEGYRYRDDQIAFIDVYWQMVSGHYLIQERERRKQELWNKFHAPKPISGPFPVEVLDPDTSEKTVNQRCLEILAERIKYYNRNEPLKFAS